jgi:hypothetical protein
MVLDALAVVIVEWFGPGGMGEHYQSLGKFPGFYDLGPRARVARTWDERLPRIIALALFTWRASRPGWSCPTS